MSQFELLRAFGGGRAGPSAYEVYVEVQKAAGQPVLSKAQWVAREGGTYDDSAVRQRLSALEEKELPDGAAGQVVGFDATGKPVAVPLPTPAATPTWGTLSGKPAEFPPVSHTHPISQIPGLQSVLDSKAESATIMTTEQIQDIVAAMFQGGTHTNAFVTYSDATGTLSVTASGGGGVPLDQEAVQDFVGGLVTEGTGVSVVYDDGGNVLRIGLSGESFTTALRNKLDSLPSSFKTIGGQSIAGSGDIPLPEAYDDAGLRALIAQLTLRVDDLDGGIANRAPNSSPVPVQTATVGLPFSLDVEGYFTDPDGDELTPLPVAGTLPPGVVQNGFSFAGTPTESGNFMVTFTAIDPNDAQASRTITWTVSAAAVAPMTVTPVAGGIRAQTLGTLPDHAITASIGGLKMELA